MIEQRKILLVDENLPDIELTLIALAEQNLANRVVVFHDGVEAMEYLLCQGEFENRNPENPAVILLDINMPYKDGYKVLHAIKTEPKLRHIPVVMLISARETPDLKTCYELGVNAYVVKPVYFKDLLKPHSN